MELEEAHAEFEQLHKRAEAARARRDELIRAERAAGATYYALSKRLNMTENGVKWICKQG